MKILCDRDILLENISLVQRAVSGRTPMPILECFLLICDENGFKMISTDQEIGIKTKIIECEIIEKGSIALPSRFFSDIVRKLPNGLVTISVEKLIATVKCQSSEFKIVGRNPEEFPELPEVERDNKYSLKQGIFKNMIRQTVFAICQDDTKPNLTGALIEINNNSVNMVTCDTFRVACRGGEILEGSGNESIIVPEKTISEMNKLLVQDNELVYVYITKKHVLFDIERCTVVSRLIEGEFINYANIFPDEFETKITVSREAITDALERASLVSYFENRKSPVRMKLEDNIVSVSTAAETGNLYEEIGVDLEGNGLEISFNPKFLLDALKCIDEESVTLEFNTPLSPCVVKPVSEPGLFKYLVLPVRSRN